MHNTTLSVRLRLKLMFDICVNVKQDLEVEAEAEHHQGVGSQPRAWGMADTHTHISRFFYFVNIITSVNF